MARYLMLLHDNPATYAAWSPADMQACVEDYLAWSDRMRQEGKLLQGEKLKDEGGRRLKRQGEKVLVTDGPYAEVKDVVGGLFVISAQSYEEAVAVAQGCPHLRYGEIELRAIDDV